MECGFLIENVIITFACFGFVAICREIYAVILWRNLKKTTEIILISDGIDAKNIWEIWEYKKWCVPQAQIKIHPELRQYKG